MLTMFQPIYLNKMVSSNACNWDIKHFKTTTTTDTTTTMTTSTTNTTSTTTIPLHLPIRLPPPLPVVLPLPLPLSLPPSPPPPLPQDKRFLNKLNAIVPYSTKKSTSECIKLLMNSNDYHVNKLVMKFISSCMIIHVTLLLSRKSNVT